MHFRHRRLLEYTLSSRSRSNLKNYEEISYVTGFRLKPHLPPRYRITHFESQAQCDDLQPYYLCITARRITSRRATRGLFKLDIRNVSCRERFPDVVRNRPTIATRDLANRGAIPRSHFNGRRKF